MSFDLAILGGKVVSGGKSAYRDIFLRGGRIAAVLPAAKRAGAARRTIDARGLLVLPGIIDAHAHFRLSLGGGKYTADDFTTGSAAAACGGVTTFIDYTGQGPGESPLKGLKDRIREAAGRTYTDFSFHCMLTGWNRMKDPSGAMAAAVRAGAPTFKMFTAYGARGLMSGDAEIFSALTAAQKLGALVCVHAENGPIIDLLTRRYAGLKSIKALPLSRPPFTEAEPASRITVFAAAACAPVYFVHLSTAGAAAVVAAARASGLKVMGETCPQYLALDESRLKGKEGHLYSCCPPLRTPDDNAALWAALAGGGLQVIATDSCTFTRAQKNAWGGDIRKLSMGLPGAQTLLAAAYTHGVKAKKITIEKMVELLCENPARIMGLAPRKGFIRPGADADFAIIDPSAATKADCRKMKHNTDFSPWQGMKLYGFPKYTLLRGEIIAESGELTDPKNFTGQFQRRTKPEFR
ncbi:MAG TPA: amidohydrolase family protein [Elusimicrobiales bacterium]|nr:amidohydrolase family protein [Elusimicrobiales bacterium]